MKKLLGMLSVFISLLLSISQLFSLCFFVFEPTERTWTFGMTLFSGIFLLFFSHIVRTMVEEDKENEDKWIEPIE